MAGNAEMIVELDKNRMTAMAQKDTAALKNMLWRPSTSGTTSLSPRTAVTRRTRESTAGNSATDRPVFPSLSRRVAHAVRRGGTS